MRNTTKAATRLLGAGLFALCSARAHAAQDVTVHFGAPNGTGSIEVLSPGGSLTPVVGLEQVELRAIDFNGRSELTRFFPTNPTLRDDVPGGRIVLPAGVGSLYKYRRPEGAGFEYGFLWVDPQGHPHAVIEHPGTGAPATADPFVGRIGVAPDGSSFLVATTPVAGGDLLEVDLAAGQVELRSASLPPLDVGPAGLVLGDAFGVAVATNGVWRFDRTPGAQAVAAPLGSPAATWFAREIARSENGQRVITIGGNAPNDAHAWVLGAAGPAVQVSENPGTLAGAGFLPDATNGPYLAVSDDGSVAAWKTVDGTGEAWLYDAAAVTPPVQLTATPTFEDTLEEVGVLTIAGLKLILGVGELNPSGDDFDAVDLFGASLQNGALQLENLSGSSGQVQPPYTAVPQMEPDAVHWLPQRQAFVVLDDDGPVNELLAIGADGSVTTLIDGVDVLWFVELVGANLVVIATPDGAQPEVRRFDSAWNGALLGTLPGVVGAESPTRGGAGWLAFFTPLPGFGEWLWRVDAVQGTLERMVPRQLILGTSAAFTGGGDLRLSVGGDVAPAQFVVWPAALPPYRSGKANVPARLLPGD